MRKEKMISFKKKKKKNKWSARKIRTMNEIFFNQLNKKIRSISNYKKTYVFQWIRKLQKIMSKKSVKKKRKEKKTKVNCKNQKVFCDINV